MTRDKDTTSSSSREKDVAIPKAFSVVDFECLQHDECVEEFLQHSVIMDPTLAVEAQDVPVSALKQDTANPKDPTEFATVSVPPLSYVVPEFRGTPEVPEPVRALHAFTREIRVLQVSAIEFYEDLRVSQVQFHPAMPPKGHVDGGAMASTTDRLDYLFRYHIFGDSERHKAPLLRVADDTTHRPKGMGYLRLPTSGTRNFLEIACYYTPEIPATIISPDAIGKALDCVGYQTYSDFQGDRSTLNLMDCSALNGDLVIGLQRIRGLLFTEPLLAPTEKERSSQATTYSPKCEDGRCCSLKTCDDCHHPWRSTVIHPLESVYCSEHINALTREQQRTLWHMRLGHINHKRVSQAHKYADGIPKLPDKDSLHSCSFCDRAKLHKAARVKHDDLNPADVECWDHIQVDFAFMVQRSRRHDEKDDDKSPNDDSPHPPLEISSLSREQNLELLRQIQSQERIRCQDI